MSVKILFIIGLASAGLLLSLMSTSAPSEVGAPGILAVFILGYITLLCFLTLIIWLGVNAIKKLNRNVRLLRNISGIKLKDSYLYSTVIALAPIIVISLNSVGGVSVYGMGLVAAFEIIGCIYVARRIA